MSDQQQRKIIIEIRLIIRKEVIIINQFRNDIISIPDYVLNDYCGEIYFTEAFVPITKISVPDIEDENRYIISNYGKVYDIIKRRKLSLWYGTSKSNNCANHTTYISVSLKTINGSKPFMLHRLVMSCFYPELGNVYNDMDINHKDGNGNNNYVSYNDPEKGNLEWATHQENMLHSYRSGLHTKGENSSISKITNNEAKKIIELLNTNQYTSKEIVNIVGGNTTIPIVDSIRKKESWTYLSEGYNFYQRPSRLFNEKDIHNFCKYFQDNPKTPNITVNDLCRNALIINGFEPLDKYVETLRKIYNKKYYKNIVSQYNF
jgi:hypothetical protein